METSEIAHIFSPYDPRDFPPTSNNAGGTTTGINNELLPLTGTDGDDYSPHTHERSVMADSNSNRIIRAGPTGKSALPVPSIPCYSTTASDGVLCAVCIVAAYSLAISTNPTNYLALFSYLMLACAAGLGSLKFAGLGGDFVWRNHPFLSVMYRTVGLPALGISYTALTLPITYQYQMWCIGILCLVHAIGYTSIGRFGDKPFQTLAAILPLPAVFYILYTCFVLGVTVGILGVVLFLASAAVVTPPKPPPETADHPNAPLYVRFPLVGSHLRVDVFHYLLAAAVACIAVPLVQLTVITRVLS